MDVDINIQYLDLDGKVVTKVIAILLIAVWGMNDKGQFPIETSNRPGDGAMEKKETL